MLILAAAENLLREAHKRTESQQWPSMSRADVFGLGIGRGLAKQAAEAVQVFRIHHAVYYPAETVPEPASLRVPKAS
jgi:hypothetical protein